jgi:Ser/Thr protein kinase RdoA (MazF antagonist)
MSGLYQDNLITELQLGVESILPLWQLSSKTKLSLLCISENATFLATDPSRDEPVVFRVHRPGYHSQKEIISELQWIEDIRANRIVDTPCPLKTIENNLVASFQHGDEQRYVVAFEFMQGSEPEESDDLAQGFYQLGEITARLHQHASQWITPADFSRKIWDFETTLGSHPHWGDWRAALGLDSDGKNQLDGCINLLAQQLDDYGSSPDRFGLIHADLRLANLLVEDDDRLSVIDFDDCGFGWYMYDFAAAISFIETSPQIPALQQTWVEGYRSIASLSSEDETAIPMFIMLRRILLTAWIASHAETPTAQELGIQYTTDTVHLACKYMQDYN